MGLRDYLNNLGAANQLTEGAAKSAQNLREQMAREQLANNLPSLIEAQDAGGLAQQTLRAGMAEPTDYIAKQLATQFAANKNKKGALTADQLPSFLPQKERERIAALPSSEDQQFQIQAFQKNLGELRQGSAEERRVQQTVQAQRKQFSGDFDKLEKDLQGEQRQIARVKDSLARGTTADDAIVFNFIARAVAGEKGPLSEGDIGRIQSNVFGNNAQAFQNFVSGGTTSRLTPEQRKAFTQIIGGASQNFDKYRDEKLADKFGRAATDHPLLVGDKGYDSAIKERAKKYGYEEKNGLLEKKKPSGTFTGRDADLANLINRIKDPAKKDQAMNALKGIQGRELSKDKLDRFEADIRKLSG